MSPIITHSQTGTTLFQGTAGATFADTVRAALAAGIDLRGATFADGDLVGVDFGTANLEWAWFYRADLRDCRIRQAAHASFLYADLAGADLRDGDLAGAHFANANCKSTAFDGARLDDANFMNANLAAASFYNAEIDLVNFLNADCQGADLRAYRCRVATFIGATLAGARLNFQSHDLLAGALLAAAGTKPERRKVAGLISVSRDWCWRQFAELHDDPEFAWALDVLAAHVHPDDARNKLPDLLRAAVIRRETAAAAAAAARTGA